MPVISPPKRVDSYVIERLEMPTVPTRNDEQNRSPSPTPKDVYQRTTSHERQSDISENFARLTLSEMHSQIYGNENIIANKIASENPIIKPTYSQSTSRENTNHSHDVSPLEKVHSNRSPSPTSGYGSSSVHGEGLSRESTSSPPSAYVPQHDYHNTRSSNGSAIDRHPSSPSSSKTNNLPSSTLTGKYPTISALIKPHRPISPANGLNDDEYDN